MVSPSGQGRCLTFQCESGGLHSQDIIKSIAQMIRIINTASFCESSTSDLQKFLKDMYPIPWVAKI